MKSIRDINISGKKVLVRVDFNVPYDEHQNITDDSRIRSVLPTLRYIMDHHSKLIIMSHMGRPGGKYDPKNSLANVAKRLGRFLEKNVEMAPDSIGPEVEEMIEGMTEGDIILLENLRFHKGETDNDDEFAKKLAALCDVYVNDAFAVCHRENASVVAITRYVREKCAGFLLQKELNYFSKAMDAPSRPLVAILGGSKVSGKISAVENMLDHVDKMIIGGAMANTFLASDGYSMGQSKIETDYLESGQSILQKVRTGKVKFYLPVDVVVSRGLGPKYEVKTVPVQEIHEEWMAFDIGPATSLLYKEVLYDAKTIIWNGPMGVFEVDAFSRGTRAMVEAVANSYALTIVGGGDTDVAIHDSHESDRISYISTGGGAFLRLMEGKPLPAVEALNGRRV